MDFSQELLNKLDTIVKHWIEAVRGDTELESPKQLTYEAVRNGLPSVLKVMATMLSHTEADDMSTLVQSSLNHGATRAKQNYDPEEVAREYHILRQIIFADLEEDLLKGSKADILRANRLINTAVDQVIAHCFNSYMTERLGELEAVQSQLELTNQELTRLVETHQENLSYLAHDLKNPLNVILISSDLFLSQNKSQSTSTNLAHVKRVIKSGRQILRLINDALEVSRYEAGKMELCADEIDVCVVIRKVVDALAPSAREKDLDIKIDDQLAPQYVTTDPLRLEQIITNLLSNAIRYTETGSIKITCYVQDDDKLAIAVTDTGIGIAPEDQALIFEPYFRSGSYANRLPDSTGLGLAIVWRLVQLLQGEIQLDSQVGVGSTFKIILPLAIQTPARQSVSVTPVNGQTKGELTL